MLLILKRNLINRAWFQTTSHFGKIQLSSLVSKGQRSSLTILLHANQKQIWQESSLSYHTENPLNFEVLITLWSFSLRLKFITNWWDWRDSRNLSVYPPVKQDQLYLEFFITDVYWTYAQKSPKLVARLCNF